jgi:ABC-2 type transport system permease protein
MSNHIAFAKTLLLTNLRASASLRGAFLIQALFMILNNLIYFSVWWIFFERFDSLQGWKLKDLAALYGLTAVSIGAMIALFGGVWNLARMAAEGGLDSLMTQPKNLLYHVVGSHSRPSGWGDIVSGFGLIAMSGYLNWEKLPLLLLLTCSSMLVMLASAVVFQSLAFWLGQVESFARQLSEFVITFSIYPQSIYPMYLRALLFTAIPAAFVSYLPVSLLRDFSWSVLLGVLAASLSYAAFAVGFFYLGLRRYESGNRFGGMV